MRSLILLGMVAGCLVSVGLSAPPATGQEKASAQDQWRYVFHDGRWWYWLPQERWVYWQGNQWNTYVPPSATASNALPRTSYYWPDAVYAGNQPLPESDIRPFYGHALSQPEYGRYYEDDIAPFYGHVVPRGPLGVGASTDLNIRPFYGHAVSSLR